MGDFKTPLNQKLKDQTCKNNNKIIEWLSNTINEPNPKVPKLYTKAPQGARCRRGVMRTPWDSSSFKENSHTQHPVRHSRPELERVHRFNVRSHDILSTTSYLCEAGVSALVVIKTNYRGNVKLAGKWGWQQHSVCFQGLRTHAGPTGSCIPFLSYVVIEVKKIFFSFNYMYYFFKQLHVVRTQILIKSFGSNYLNRPSRHFFWSRGAARKLPRHQVLRSFGSLWPNLVIYVETYTPTSRIREYTFFSSV